MIECPRGRLVADLDGSMSAFFNGDTAVVVTTFELTQVSAASAVAGKARPVILSSIRS
jgi:hypothetical protein